MTFYEDLVVGGREHPERLVSVERGADRATVTLADPDKLNVLSAPLVQQLKATLEELLADRAVRAIVLTGAGSGFSAGGDLRMMEEAPSCLASPAGATDIWRWIRYEFGGIARLIARSDTAFVAALNGPAAGVGLAWALTCDLVIASERAQIVPAFGRLGLLPEVGTSWALTRRLGYQGAFAFYAAGEHLDAERARELGASRSATGGSRCQLGAAVIGPSSTVRPHSLASYCADRAKGSGSNGPRVLHHG